MDQQVLAKLANEARQRDVEAFGRIYDICVGSVYLYAFYRIGNRLDAEDVTEETFLRAFRSIGRYEQRENPFTAWLFTIGRAAVADFYRKKQPRRTETGLEAEALESMSDPRAHMELAAGLYAEDLAGLIKRLSSDQQNVIALRFLAGLKLSETAAMLGKNENAVKALQHRALEALRKMMET
ncbi:MAG: sigma-70 family RNA polymerase sigma factor [Actinomycetota bacterium]